jgi:hypothetical protein
MDNVQNCDSYTYITTIQIAVGQCGASFSVPYVTKSYLCV